MSNSVIEAFKNKEDLGNTRDNSKASKRFFPVRNAVKIALILVALGVLVPTPVQAKISRSSQSYSFSDAEKQVEFQGEISYSEEEIKKGTENVEELIKSYESELKSNWYHNAKKTPEELANDRYIANVLRGLDKNSLGKCFESADALNYGDNKYRIIILNEEIVRYEVEGKNLTEDFKQGEENLKEAIKNLQSKSRIDGEIKTEKELLKDKRLALYLGEFLITRNNLYLFYLNNRAHPIGFSNLDSSNIISRGIIFRNLDFMATETNEKCEITRFSDDSTDVTMLNDKYLSYSKLENGEWRSYTYEMNEEIEKQKKQNTSELQQ